mmetsp:Transcript_24340/g.57495  ORF Transcript_24340/g.57495 Transcript_24340/m.57495 type:complete len:92 (-) Transcript_24340:999-1274(-)
MGIGFAAELFHEVLWASAAAAVDAPGLGAVADQLMDAGEAGGASPAAMPGADADKPAPVASPVVSPLREYPGATAGATPGACASTLGPCAS